MEFQWRIPGILGLYILLNLRVPLLFVFFWNVADEHLSNIIFCVFAVLLGLGIYLAISYIFYVQVLYPICRWCLILPRAASQTLI